MSASKKKKKNPRSIKREIAGVILIAVALMLGVGLYADSGALLSMWIRRLFFGLLGVFSYALPVLLLAGGVLLIAVRKPFLNTGKTILCAVGVWSLMAFVHLCCEAKTSFELPYGEYLSYCYQVSSETCLGGGFFGGVLAWPIYNLMGLAGGLIFYGALILICIMIVTSLSLRSIGQSIGSLVSEARANSAHKERTQRTAPARREKDSRVTYLDTSAEEPPLRVVKETPEETRSRKSIEKAYRETFSYEQPVRRKSRLYIEQVGEDDTIRRQPALRETLHPTEEEPGTCTEEPAAPLPGTVTPPPQDLFDSRPHPRHNGYSPFNPPPGSRPPAAPPEAWEKLYYRSRPQPKPVESQPEEEVVFTYEGPDAGFYQEGYDSYDTYDEPDAYPPEPEEEDPVSFSYEPDEEEAPAMSFVPDEQDETPAAPVRSLRMITPRPVPAAAAPVPPAAPQKRMPIPQDMQKDFIYCPPPVTLLDKPVETAGRRREDIQGKSALLENTLKSFGITAKVINVCCGPVVTRYELQPAPGVKVSRIENLTKDIALSLAAESIRIEAPIPGKAAVGIEIPNAHSSMVTIRELIDSPEFHKMKGDLAFCLGKDISGKNVYGDLAKMPHLLIAGTTGSGKSVCVNTIIFSLLYHADPSRVQMIMIDPKVVEMTAYNGIPFLKIPVLTDKKKAAGALNWAVNEMVERYKIFAAKGVKEIERYNALAQENGEEIMQKLVIFIDELADLMMVAANEVEDAICRIAQLGRASGIHLVVATQSPRVDVITGLIKANIPSRIALKVSSQIDSRVILDAGGAEKLLGHGDMLFYPTGAPRTTRVQGCYISDSEVEAVTDNLKEKNSLAYDEELDREIERAAAAASAGKNGKSDPDPEGDDLVAQAIKLGLEYEQISASMLQRKLRIGYPKAARLVDELEEMGAVTPADGSKSRKMRITWEEYYARFEGGEQGETVEYEE